MFALIKKLHIYSILLASIFLVSACSDQKEEDKNLNGVWSGNLVDSKNSTEFNIIYEFDNQNVKIIKSMNLGQMDNTIEVRIGDYKKMDTLDKRSLKVSLKSHSCSTVSSAVQYEETFNYNYVNGVDEIRVQYGINQYLLLRRMSDSEVESLDAFLSSASLGCYIKNSSNKFEFKSI